jgi:hypothetical protein
MNRNSSLLVLRIALELQQSGPGRQIILDLLLRGDPTDWSASNLDVLSSPIALPEIAASDTTDIRMQTHALGSWRMTQEELGLPSQWEDIGKLKDQSRPWLKLVLTGIDSLLMSKVLPEYRVGWVSSFSAPISLPIAVQRAMKALLAHWQVTDQPLWLEFATGADYLPLLPWERILQDVMQQPVLRLSYQRLPTILPRTSVQVAVCVSAADDSRLTAKTLPSLITAISSTLPDRSKVHVFADEVAYPLIANVPSTFGASIVVHRPEAENGTEGAQGSSLTRPWTDWIRTALQGRAIDALHIVARGIPTPGSPSIALRFAPAGSASRDSKREPLRQISTQALHDLAVELGAWCVLCTSPGGSLSRLALRLLVDMLAKRHLHVAALHDLATDEQSSALSLTYKFLFGGGDSPPPNSEAMTIYCDPAFAGRTITTAEPPVLNALRELSEQTNAAQATGEPLPSWMAASQRYLEQTAWNAASLAAQPESDKAVSEGVTDALRTISRIIKQMPK